MTSYPRLTYPPSVEALLVATWAKADGRDALVTELESVTSTPNRGNMDNRKQFRQLSKLRDLTSEECKEAFASPIWANDRLVYPKLGEVLERVYRETFRGLEQETPQSFPGRFPHPEYVRCWEISNKVLAVWDELAADVEFVVLDLSCITF